MTKKLNAQDLVDNPAPRIPVSLCLDTSASMSGDRVNELMKGVGAFYSAVASHEDAHDSAEISVVSFGSKAKIVQDFAGIDDIDRNLEIDPDGKTYMGEGVNLALDALQKRKAMYSSLGVLWFQPWLVLMTDGKPNGDKEELDTAIKRVQELVAKKKLTVFPIGIGHDADMRILAEFSPNRPPLRLQGLKFVEFFEWLSKSVENVSQSIPTQEVPLDLKGLAGWAEL